MLQIHTEMVQYFLFPLLSSNFANTTQHKYTNMVLKFFLCFGEQVLRNKLENLKKKVLDSIPTQPSDRAEFISASVNELEKQLTEFGKIMEDYKKNLELLEHLQEMMEEV